MDGTKLAMPINEMPDCETQRRIAANLKSVGSAIVSAARAVDRNPDDVRLIAVSKSQPIDRIRAALTAGHRIFGENRIQEAIDRWTTLRPEFSDIELHFIGHLQSNKAAEAVALFDVIHSIDRPKIAGALAKEARRQARRPTCLLQINTGGESQKSGASPGDARQLLKVCREEFDLTISGLMCIPPVDEEPSPHFALLADLANRLDLPMVSMGMSGDYEIAVRLGATHVRVGTAIFGMREPRQ